jgi:DNA-binding transcriptional LysR family regulator
MELRHLRYFVAVGEEQHFGRAARRLRVAQPALSHQIHDLEREIGFELFDRLPRGVQLNAAGKQFLDDTRRILAENRDAISNAKRLAEGQDGTLKVAFTESLAWSKIFQATLRAFRKRYPGVDLQLRPMTAVEQLPLVESGALDGGFGCAMAPVPLHLNDLRLGFVTLLLAVPAGHPLSKRKSVHLKNLVNESFICIPRRSNPPLVDNLVAACARGGLKNIQVSHEAASEPVTLSMVACGAGVAFVSDCMQGSHPPDTVLLPVSDLKLRLPYRLVWRKRNKSHLMANFVDELRTIAGIRSAP